MTSFCRLDNNWSSLLNRSMRQLQKIRIAAQPVRMGPTNNPEWEISG